jgi:hypothetical protein
MSRQSWSVRMTETAAGALEGSQPFVGGAVAVSSGEPRGSQGRLAVGEAQHLVFVRAEPSSRTDARSTPRCPRASPLSFGSPRRSSCGRAPAARVVLAAHGCAASRPRATAAAGPCSTPSFRCFWCRGATVRRYPASRMSERRRGRPIPHSRVPPCGECDRPDRPRRGRASRRKEGRGDERRTAQLHRQKSLLPLRRRDPAGTPENGLSRLECRQRDRAVPISRALAFVAKELRAWAVPGDRFYDQDFEVVGWTARKSDHANYLIVNVSTDDAREGRPGVPCGNDELGSATPQAIAGDPAAAGRLDHRRRRCALRHGTLVGPGVRRPLGP